MTFIYDCLSCSSSKKPFDVLSTSTPEGTLMVDWMAHTLGKRFIQLYLVYEYIWTSRRGNKTWLNYAGFNSIF